ncbi:MAG: molybdopterin converting factor subunit 1 [Alphaproteobacteria bacterium]|nr:MAG: molybdopterin converting factor subunit 1 [Alphaproteobacteria bacterium]
MTILYFAWLKEKIGKDEEQVDPPAEITNIGELVEWLAQRGPGYADAFADREIVRAAIDQEFAETDAPIAGATEIAFFPPVTGG